MCLMRKKTKISVLLTLLLLIPTVAFCQDVDTKNSGLLSKNLELLQSMRRDNWPPPPKGFLHHATFLEGNEKFFHIVARDREAIFFGDNPLRVPEGKSAVITEIELIGEEETPVRFILSTGSWKPAKEYSGGLPQPIADTEPQEYKMQEKLGAFEGESLSQLDSVLMNRRNEFKWKDIELWHSEPKSITNLWVKHFEVGGRKARFFPGLLIPENHQLDVVSEVCKKSTSGVPTNGSRSLDRKLFSIRIVYRGYFIDADSELVRTRDVLNALQSKDLGFESKTPEKGKE